MGKQSSRMIYRGKDHKDIFFQGHYHDAMYKGTELVWHKIRREGYYSIIVRTKMREMLVLIFNEKTGEFEEIMKIKNNTESPAYYIPLLSSADGERIYVSTLGTESLAAASIDGINFGNTNLDYEDIYYGFWTGDHYYSNYIWSLYQSGSYYLSKVEVIFKNQVFSVNPKTVHTGLSVGDRDYEYTNIEVREYNAFLKLVGKNGKFPVHLHRTYYYYKDTKKKKFICVLKYYDVENETIGEITEISQEDLDGLYVSPVFFVNNKYIFFIDKLLKNNIHKTYGYYSEDGINYNDFFMDSFKGAGIGVLPSYVAFRDGVYYIYTSDKYNQNDISSIVNLTIDFEHFFEKELPFEVDIDGNKINVKKMVYGLNLDDYIYFYNGERSNPEYGMLSRYENYICYLDNMFFRESKGNKYIELTFY